MFYDFSCDRKNEMDPLGRKNRPKIGKMGNKNLRCLVASGKTCFTVFCSKMVQKINENRGLRGARDEKCDFWRMCRIYQPCQRKYRFLHREFLPNSSKYYLKIEKNRRSKKKIKHFFKRFSRFWPDFGTPGGAPKRKKSKKGVRKGMPKKWRTKNQTIQTQAPSLAE